MFALRLKQLREDAGISQAQLAIKLGVRQSTVGMWENGKNKPQNAKLESLASMFGVSTDYLLGRSDEPTETPQEVIAPRTPEARLISAGIDGMSEEKRKRALTMFNVLFEQFREEEKKG